MRTVIAAIAAVFMYHHVAPSAPPGRWARALTVSPTEFARQLGWLRGHGCALVTTSKIVSDARAGKLAACEVALTFDDGYADAARFAAPLLAEDRSVGTFFIETGAIGSSGHLTVAQLKHLDAMGMELGAHTVHHVDLTLVSPAARDAEIRGSIAALHAWTGKDIEDFAYPAGRFDAAVEAAARSDGVNAAFTTNAGRFASRALADVFALPRYRVLHGSGLELFASVLGSGAGTATPRMTPQEAAAIARERAEGNDIPTAELIGQRVLLASFPEPIQKVRVLTVPPAIVAGIMLSGVGLHVPVSPQEFESDARAMAASALAAAPHVDEVDVWAVVPQAVPAGATVTGDLAIPTDRTVFSVAVRRGAPVERAFVDGAWAAQLQRKNLAWQN